LVCQRAKRLSSDASVDIRVRKQGPFRKREYFARNFLQWRGIQEGTDIADEMKYVSFCRGGPKCVSPDCGVRFVASAEA